MISNSPGPEADPHRRLTVGPLDSRLMIGQGWMTLSRPLRFTTSDGEGVAAGAFSFDGRVDLKGALVLSPDFAARVARNKIKPLGPVEAPIQLSGRWTKLTARLDKMTIVKTLIDPSSAKRGLDRKARELAPKR